MTDRQKFAVLSRKAFLAERAVQRRFEPLLKNYVVGVSRRVRDNESPDKATTEEKSSLHKGILELKHELCPVMALDGYKVGGGLTGSKSFQRYLAKAAVSTIPVVDESFFGSDALIASHLDAKLAPWIENTSSIETNTTAKEIEDLMHQAMLSRDDPMTPADLAKMLLDNGIAGCQSRANLLSATCTNWTYNEGAVYAFQEVGFSKAEWLTTEDDVTCEFCSMMDGKEFELGQPIFKEGQSIYGSSGELMILGITVEHAPLHPYCRCTVAVTS